MSVAAACVEFVVSFFFRVSSVPFFLDEVFQGFDFTYFFREVKLHEVLVHVFIKRGEVKFS
jgi:hypothetical protein